MRPRDLSVTIALCVSLVVHAVLMLALTEGEILDQRKFLHHPPLDRSALAAHHADFAEPSPIAAALPEPELPEELFGEHGGKGKASSSAAGDHPMEARKADEVQAALTPNPGDRAESPSSAGAPGSASAASASASAAGRPSSPGMIVLPFGPPPAPDAPFGIPLAPAPPPLAPKPFRQTPPPIIGVPVAGPDPNPIHSAVTMGESPATRPVNEPPATRPANVAVDLPPTTLPITDAATTRPVTVALAQPRPADMPVGQLPTTTQPSPVKVPTTRSMLALASAADGMRAVESPATPAAAAPAPAFAGAPAGDLGHQSDSEVDPFADSPIFTYHDGKVEARDGREVKTVRPRLTEAGRAALIGMENPRVIFVVHIDERGKVTNVDYLHRSGSNDVDLPTYRSLFDWEFEPSKDAAGRAKPDNLIISIIWR